jgi:hypothetical protein
LRKKFEYRALFAGYTGRCECGRVYAASAKGCRYDSEASAILADVLVMIVREQVHCVRTVCEVATDQFIIDS